MSVTFLLNLQPNGNRPSIRRKYITHTVVLGIAVISIVLIIFNETISTRQQVRDQLDSIQKKLNQLNTLQSNQVEIYRNINLFLLDPTEGNRKNTVHLLLKKSTQIVSKLNKSISSDENRLNNQVKNLGDIYKNLENSTHNLIESRLDIQKQFPGMSLSANYMVPIQRVIANNLQILIDEIESQELQPASSKLYTTLLKTYSLWQSQISQMRIYLTNRFASFSIEILNEQAISLYDLSDKFSSNIKELAAIYQHEDSFEGPDIIKSLEADSTEWITLFKQVQSITESDGWRSDNVILKKNIIPQSDEISQLILSIEKSLFTQRDLASEQLKNITDTLSALIIFIIALFMIFIITMLYSLDWMVFKPITKVTQALKSKAFNKSTSLLLENRTLEISNLIEAFQEMDEKVSQRQGALEHQALHDHLTGLPNRLMLNQHLEYQLLAAKRNNKNFSLLLMDLDHFKDVNDSLGHAIGDILLINTSKRLTEHIRKSDTVTRLGGDEFAILLPEANSSEAELIIKNIINSIEKSFIIDGNTINIGISIGIACFPDDGTDATTLMQHADMAMYVAKRNQIGFSHYDESEDFISSNRLTLITDLRNALDNDSLKLYFQPQVDIDGLTVTGAEALLRWEHPEYGFIQPEKIVELAEYIGIIHQLSIWVLEKAIEQCSYWHQQGEQISIAVNLSVHDLTNTKLCENIDSLLKQYNLESNFLTLEITESGMMENPARSTEILNTLSSMGINLSIDDFGTGFSSLSYLKQLPVNELKIDKSFIMNMDNDESDVVIVQSTIHLGHNLGLKVIAEGIEHEGLLHLAKQLGCDKYQGYLFGKPQNSEQFLKLIQSKSL